jgi:cytochrome c biogenesis protein CcmG/thiol:disulfide interchange protein DsbE
MSSSRNKGLLVVLVVGLVVAIAAVLAFGVTGGSNSDDATDDTTIDSSNGSSMSETQPVTVVGDPLTPFDTPQNDASIGSTPPTLEGFAFDGSSLSIAPGSTGRATMVVFLAHWCPHCNAEIPVLIEWNESGGVPANLDVIGVSTAVFDDRDNYPPSQWIDDKGFPWPVLADSENSEAAVAYGVTGFPTFTLIDENGKVLYRADGEKTLEELELIIATFFPST